MPNCFRTVLKLTVKLSSAEVELKFL